MKNARANQVTMQAKAMWSYCAKHSLHVGFGIVLIDPRGGLP